MKVKYGWKPGAVSKRLLKMLNIAKLRKSAVTEVKLIKRQRKRVENKPLIVVGKINGQYHIEMQVINDNNDQEQYTPVKYSIEDVYNKAKIKKKEKLQKHLNFTAVKDIWSDPYHPENCENICLKAFYDSIGITPEHKPPKNIVDSKSCSCDYEEISSSCDSSEIDWELQFSPPIARYLRVHSCYVNEFNLP